jgi:hypothetical protein
MVNGLTQAAIEALRRAGTRVCRPGRPRKILVDGRTPVNYVMVAPLHRAMGGDRRVEFYFTASEEPHRLRDIYSNAPKDLRLISPRRAALMKFDAWSRPISCGPPSRAPAESDLPGGRDGFSATTSMRDWDRLFFVNERDAELRRCRASSGQRRSAWSACRRLTAS